jgi:hypothetical protein
MEINGQADIHFHLYSTESCTIKREKMNIDDDD